MSKGRKAVVHNNSDWESVFYNSVGTYVQYINLKLAEQFKSEPLSNHIRIAGGYAFKSSQYKKQGVPVIRISNFSNEKIVLDDVVYYEESKDLERYELHEGDIVIALTGGTIAKLGIVQKGIGKLYLNQRVGKFEILHPEEFETEYVYWIARSVQSIIKNLAWGAAIPNVSPKQIEELQFPIPDKKTQNGIIDFLNDLKGNKLEEDKEYFNSEVEDFIFLLQVNQISGAELQSELIQQQDLLNQFRQAILHEAIQGKLVKQKKDDGIAIDLLKIIKTDQENLIKVKKIKRVNPLSQIRDEEVPFNIPENWEWCRLGDLRDFQYSLSYGVLVPGDDVPNGVPFVRVQDLDFADKEELPSKHISVEISNKYSKTILVGGEILICVVGSIGKVALASERWIGANIARAVCRYMPNKRISRKYLFYCLTSPFIQNFFKSQQKSVNPTLNVNILETTLIPLPPIIEQERIVNKLEEVMSFCDDLFESINQSKVEIERLIKTLLNDALGEITIYDDSKDKTLKRKIVKFFTDGNTTETISMKIIEILKTSPLPISATVVWNSSEYSKDIETFYAELKRLIDIEKLVVEEKRGKESFLKLATNEN